MDATQLAEMLDLLRQTLTAVAQGSAGPAGPDPRLMRPTKMTAEVITSAAQRPEEMSFEDEFARSPTPPSTPSDSQLRLKRTPVQVKATINLLSNAANPSQEATTDNDGDGKRNWEEMEKETGDDTSVPEEESARIFPLLVEMGTAASRALDSHGPPVWALDARGPPFWALDTRGPSIWVLDAQAPPTQA
ncbi:UNVERIFIED_CONTAM: hypothetical protein FKN15_050796 [Acipenser sinensis]